MVLVIATTTVSTSDKAGIIRFLVLEMGCEAENATDQQDLGRTPLLFACKERSGLELIKTLVELGARVNTRDENGMNALFTYVDTIPTGSYEEGHSDVVRFLLDAGADVHMQSTSEESVMVVASTRRLTKVVRMLDKHICLKLSKLLKMQRSIQDDT